MKYVTIVTKKARIELALCPFSTKEFVRDETLQNSVIYYPFQFNSEPHYMFLKSNIS